MKFKGITAALLLTLALGTGWLTASAQVTNLDVAGSSQTEFYGINNAGDVVGAYIDSATGRRHGFIRLGEGGAVQAIDFPGAKVSWTEAWDVTDPVSGKLTIIGQFMALSQIHGFVAVYDGAEFSYESVDVVVRAHTMASGINSFGLIVGCMHSAGEADMRPWTLSNGSFRFVDLFPAMYTRVNDYGAITGFGYNPQLTSGQSFVVQNGHFDWFRVNNARFTRSYGINNSGDTVGFYWGDGTPGMHGFLRTASGGVTAIDVSSASMTHAYDINNKGTVVGAYKAAGLWHAFRYPQ